MHCEGTQIRTLSIGNKKFQLKATVKDLVIEQDKISTASKKNEIQTLVLDRQQSKQLQKYTHEIAAGGGPQSINAENFVTAAATELKVSFSPAQLELIELFSDGCISLLIFEGLESISNELPPNILPAERLLENRHDVLCLAVRNQILLKLVDHRTFSYDIDNHGKIVRLVANFKGGGATRLDGETEEIEISSHSGISLGPHTEAPYWCSLTPENGHSPAPSALILSALWNPRLEPTSVIPLAPVLESTGVTFSLALTSRHFSFTRSDSFTAGKGEAGESVSILKFDEKIGFAARFNSYRFSVNENAPILVRNAYKKFCSVIEGAVPFQYTLTQNSAMIINNNRALHCRDVVKDNRRLLVRLFGLSKYSVPVVISQNPLLVRG